MRAIATWPPSRGSARLIEAPRPEPSRGEVLLRVVRVGIDGTDREINDGKYGSPPSGSDFLIIGHEALCVVEEVTEETWVRRGDLVVPTVRRPDDCVNCAAGEPDMCVKGEYLEHGIKGLHGFAAEYGVSDERFLVKVPDEIENVAVLLEPLSIAEKAVEEVYKVQERMTWGPRRALVLGAGPLGLLIALLLRLRDLEVVAVARSPRTSLKAMLTEEMGASYINARERGITTLGLFDIVLEATGKSGVAIEALRTLRPNGVLCLLGVYSDDPDCRGMGLLLRDVVLGNKVIVGSVNSSIRHFHRGISDMMSAEKRYPGLLERFITSRRRPEEYQAALQRGVDEVKTVIEFWDRSSY